MKKLLLSVAIGAGLAAGALVSPSGASAEIVAVVVPPNPIINEPLSVSVSQISETEVIPLVSVGVNPGPPDIETHPPDPGLELLTPGVIISR